MKADFTLGISGLDGAPARADSNKIFCTREPSVEGSGYSWGYNGLLSWADIIAASPENYLPTSGVLTITATITVKDLIRVAAAVPPPPSTLTTFLAPVVTGTHTWELKGLTPAHFRSVAKRDGETIYSPEFESCGHRWKLCAFLGNTDVITDEDFVYVALCLVSPDAVVPNVDFTVQVRGDDVPFRGSATYYTREEP